ncbi:cGMP-dependent protein kinase 1 [Pogona vitticeps]|uniref:cGMP-dependent protein kinase n=1 Tax=Pogona vitticeps TaxID=103695 RepID=A0A6J0V0B3_9SAUR|nr:cGMP-dependent protein kinase 1-like [Pogona vitticeps]XP_020663995.1 cGMP-dependent protein kinase 1-like [Pogona vitticeps]XP_020663996.1 cGMP-dependent protein kinase 1-like [Pogona vitticeps]
MDLRLRELRLQEEKAFLESMALTPPEGDPEPARELVGEESPRDQSPPGEEEARRGSRGQAIVPEPLDTGDDWQVPCVPKSPRDASLILEAVKRNEFLRCLGDGQSQPLVESFTPKQCQPGETVVAEGDDGHHMYIVAEGELCVTQKGRHLRQLLPGDVFGELAVLYHCQRTATVTARTGVQLWAIDRQAYRTIVTESAKRRRAQVLAGLRGVKPLQGLSDAALSQLLDSAEERTFAPNELIIQEGDEGRTFFFVLSGQVEVTRNVDGQEEFIRVLKGGDHFGELALIRNIRRTASCRALEEVTCIAIAKEDFQELSPMCAPRELEATVPEAPPLSETGRGSLLEGASAPLRLQDLEAVLYEDGEHRGRPVVLGTGGFGTVELVRSAEEGAPPGEERLFALKRLRKDHVVQKRQQEHVLMEKAVLLRSRCPFIVRVFATFRDSRHVYLLLEFCQGGELWAKLREVRCFSEPVAVFCSACVVEALDYLHAQGIVYRDLKPENLMLDAQGYIKLVDFGFAKALKRGEKTYSFCGTPEYLAPEILRHEGHDFAVDFWTLGVLIFEMLVGRPPFHSAEPQKIYSKIMDGVFSFPVFVSEAACSIVAKLCRRRPGQRLGNTSGGIRAIRKHRWFSSLSWKKLALRQMEAPTTVLLKQGPPYANFKRFSLSPQLPEEEFSGWDEDF